MRADMKPTQIYWNRLTWNVIFYRVGQMIFGGSLAGGQLMQKDAYTRPMVGLKHGVEDTQENRWYQSGQIW